LAKASEQYGITQVSNFDVRASNRRRLSAAEVSALSKASSIERQKYTINSIAFHEELWTIWDGNELPLFESTANDVLHIWPHQQFAEQFASPTIADPRSVPIPLDDFLDEILLLENGDPTDVAYFPIGTGKEAIFGSSSEFASLVSIEWRRTYGKVQLRRQFTFYNET